MRTPRPRTFGETSHLPRTGAHGPMYAKANLYVATPPRMLQPQGGHVATGCLTLRSPVAIVSPRTPTHVLAGSKKDRRRKKLPVRPLSARTVQIASAAQACS